MKKFYAPSSEDKRIIYACEYLEDLGYNKVSKLKNADFVLLGVNPNCLQDYDEKPVFAGNISANNVFDYTKNECFALNNAYLTSEAAISIATSNSDVSLVGSSVLILGFGRIGRALLEFLKSYTSNITVCARNPVQQELATLLGSKSYSFDEISGDFDFVFNTVPHPVINEKELVILKDATIIDLASFPGGVDNNYAKLLNVNLVVARGLPSKLSPKSAGMILANTVDLMIKQMEV